ncbi:MAG TPA: hypothetical protein VFD68_00285, partial [Gemmatimonadales bacterium]|nr:hypothetical protein [Gemmatimonadales bacterium]
MLLHDLVQTSRRVAKTSGRLAKIGLLADVLGRATADEIETAIAFLSGTTAVERLGVGWAALQAARGHATAKAPSLELGTVVAALRRLAGTSGPGSVLTKKRILGELFASATPEEQEFLLSLLAGELRQGALEGLVTEAVARVAGQDAEVIRRATMVAGDLGVVARAAVMQGASGLAAFRVQL